MSKLNLETKCVEHTVLKEYLEENASPILVEKINNGARIEKDGKTLLNKKDLQSFMIYACNEARKIAAQGANSACVKSDIVFGWLVHYFEEDSIEGTLYNEDGTKYSKPLPKPTQSKPAPTAPAKPTPPKPQQFTFFDLVNNSATTPAVEEKTTVEEPDLLDKYNVDDETGEILSEKLPQKEAAQGSSLYLKYLSYKKEYPKHLIAYRIGDFYELFDDDAIRVSRYMDLTLTSRDCGKAERVAMVGIPYHAADPYFMKIASKYDLAIVDDGEVTIMENEETVFVREDITETEKKELFGDDLYADTQNTPTNTENNDDLDEFEEERALQKFFDKDTLCVLYELFDGAFDMQ